MNEPLSSNEDISVESLLAIATRTESTDTERSLANQCLRLLDRLLRAHETTQPSASNPMTPRQRDAHARWLTLMLEYYNGEEKTLRTRLDKREVWGDGYENEWRRYQAEAAALRAGIEALQPSVETLLDSKKELYVEAFAILSRVEKLLLDTRAAPETSTPRYYCKNCSCPECGNTLPARLQTDLARYQDRALRGSQ